MRRVEAKARVEVVALTVECRAAPPGVVFGVERHFADDPGMLYVQSDLSLNPGNSGGPLLDIDGVIVGMNVRAIVSGAGSPGVSLSIPIDVVLCMTADLKTAIARAAARFRPAGPARARLPSR